MHHLSSELIRGTVTRKKTFYNILNKTTSWESYIKSKENVSNLPSTTPSLGEPLRSWCNWFHNFEAAPGKCLLSKIVMNYQYMLALRGMDRLIIKIIQYLYSAYIVNTSKAL